nr:PEP-CTERM sorting domain-containing protein [uncultured Roseococcus sp.]
MPRLVLLLLLAAGLLPMANQASRADVILDFTQVGPTIETPYGGGAPFPNAILSDITLVLTDEAYSWGVKLSQRNGGGVPHAQLDGLSDLRIEMRNLLEAFSVSLADFTKDIPIHSTERSAIELTSSPGGLPVGSVFYSSPLDLSVRFTFDGTDHVSGYISGDGSCFMGCRFGGVLTVSVPEPASLLTFGLGLLALGMVLRRRQA